MGGLWTACFYRIYFGVLALVAELLGHKMEDIKE